MWVYVCVSHVSNISICLCVCMCDVKESNAVSVTSQVRFITESTVLSNLLRRPLKTNKKPSDIKTRLYGITFKKCVCDLSALNASLFLRSLWFFFYTLHIFQKGWWMSRLRQALYGEWVNRLRGASTAVHYSPLPLLQPQKLLRNMLRKPQQRQRDKAIQTHVH